MKKIVIEKDIKHEDFKNVSLNKNKYVKKRKPPEVKIISLEVMKSIKYHSAVLMIRDIYLMIHNIQSYEYGHYKINHWFIRQRAFIEIWSTREVWRARNMRSWEQLSLLECSLNFPSASYLNERIADVGTNCFITFSTRRKIFFLRDMFGDVMSVHNRNMKHARAVEFDQTNLLAML